jgi:hypothetical protein
MGVGSLLGVSAGLQPVFRRFDFDYLHLRTIGEMAITSVLHAEVRGSTPLSSTCSQIGKLAKPLDLGSGV